MSISDELMARYYELLLDRPLPKDAHPLEAKKQLAFEIVENLPLGRRRQENARRMERAF